MLYNLAVIPLLKEQKLACLAVQARTLRLQVAVTFLFIVVQRFLLRLREGCGLMIKYYLLT